jgi:DNA-binding LytR/AlgR family response regulator
MTVDIILYDNSSDHLARLERICIGYCFKKNTDDRIVAKRIATEAEAAACDRDLVCTCMLGLSAKVKDMTIRIRAKKPHDYLVFVGNDAEEAIRYMTPATRPSGFVFRPADKAVVEQLLEEINADFTASGDGERFVFKIQSASYSVPLEKIVYFEAASKKVRLRTNAQEFTFYDALDALEERLSSGFMRIHKSFLVNTARIASVDFAGMTVLFDEGSTAFISRTHKAALRAFMEGVE